MKAYLLLAGISAIVALGTYRVFRKTRQWSFLLGMAMLYFWTFLGAWFFIGDALSGYKGYQIGLGYYYLMEKMFPFELDPCYLVSLMGYGAFTAALLAGVLLLAPSAVKEVHAGPLIKLDHRVFLVIAAAASVCSFLLVRPVILLAVEQQESVYLVTRTTPYQGASLHALCNELAAFSLLLGWALFLTADRPRYFATMGRRWPRWAYPAALLAWELYMVMLGNKHELFMGMLLGVLLFVANANRPRYGILLVYLACCTVPMFVTSAIRGASLQEIKALDVHQPRDTEPYRVPIIKHVPRAPKPDGLVMRAGQSFLSNEMFAAHFSMYGICRFQIAPVSAVSFKYLQAACIPRILKQERPPTTYQVYASGAGLVPGQGYTIHQAAGWYLNGGWPMVVFGGLALGAAWGLLMRWRARPLGRGIVWRTISVMAVSCWVAYLPILLRDGPELLKGLVVEGMAIPIGAVLLSAFVANALGPNRNVDHGA